MWCGPSHSGISPELAGNAGSQAPLSPAESQTLRSSQALQGGSDAQSGFRVTAIASWNLGYIKPSLHNKTSFTALRVILTLNKLMTLYT